MDEPQSESQDHISAEQAELDARRKNILVGVTLDGLYEIDAELIASSLGKVYKARHALMGRPVTVKVLHQWLCNDERALARMKQEARALTSLNQKNIVKVHDVAVSEKGQAYLVMDDWDGTTLTEWLSSRGPLPWAYAVDVFTQICDALSHAHKRGIIHRDLRPDNIILKEQGEAGFTVKLIDFGLAKLVNVEPDLGKNLTPTGDLIGNPVYMSPEQCQGRQLSAASDIYSLGCVMYETLCGRPPFTAATPAELVTKHLHNDPAQFRDVAPDREIPSWLESLVMRTLEKDRERRIKSAAEVSQALRLIGASTNSRGFSMTRTGLQGPSVKRISRRSVVLLASLMLLPLCLYFASTQQGRVRILELQIFVISTVGSAEDPRLIGPLSGLAQIYKEQGRWLEASACYKKLIPAIEQRFSERSPEMMETLLDQADALRHSGERSEYTKAVDKVSQIACTPGSSGKLDPDARLALLFRILNEQRGGDQDYDLAGILGSIGSCYHDKHDWSKAARFYRQQVDVLLHTKVSGITDGGTITACRDLGNCYVELGNLSRAQELYELALTGLKQTGYQVYWQENSGLAEDTLRQLVNICARQKKFDRAEYFADQFRLYCSDKHGAASAQAEEAEHLAKWVEELRTRSSGSPIQGSNMN